MIQDQSRDGWFGASDSSYIMGRWTTKTFAKWWSQKLGVNDSHFTNAAMNAGTYYEGAVLDHIGAPRRDHQILLPELLVRVNLDGDGPRQIYEVKTHSAAKEFKVTKAYWQQVQVQMYAKSKEEGCVPLAQIVSYALEEKDYADFFRPIDPARLKRHYIEYDGGFIREWLKRVEYLSECLRRGAWPDEITR